MSAVREAYLTVQLKGIVSFSFITEQVITSGNVVNVFRRYTLSAVAGILSLVGQKPTITVSWARGHQFLVFVFRLTQGI
jgi:hypothetical protein